MATIAQAQHVEQAHFERFWPNTPKLEMYYEPKTDPEAARAHVEPLAATGRARPRAALTALLSFLIGSPHSSTDRSGL